MKIVGKPIPHESAREHVTGRALYSDDLIGRFTNVLHAWPVQAPHAHAKILSLKTEGALEVPGVLQVLTAADVPGHNNIGPVRPDEPLFPDEVMYHAQAVAWVIAETEEAARLGAERVEALYKPLPAVLTLEEAINKQSFLNEPLKVRKGEPEQALLEAPHKLKGKLEIGPQEHFYLETQATLAYLDEYGQVMLQCSTQHPTETQTLVAEVLGLPRNQVTVQCLRMGGGFGGKETQANAWAAVAALAAWKTGRPVRARLNRTQDMTLTGKRHPFLSKFSVGFDDEGRILGLKLELYSDGGWSLDLSEAVLLRALLHADNAYHIPHMEVIGRVCKTNKTSQTAFRGFGGPQGMVVIEEVLDRVARTLGLAPEVVRERNFYREGDTTHYLQPVKDAERIERIWYELKTSSDFTARRQHIAEFNAAHPHKKRGIALTPVKFGISFNAIQYNQAGALVLVYQDGSVLVNHGGTEMGQGVHTKILQVAAQSLGVPLESVRLAPTRTDKIPNTSATAASTGSDLNGAAVKNACETIKARLAEVAAQRFGVNPQDVAFEEGQVYPLGVPEKALPFAEIAKAAFMQRVQLWSDGFYRTPGLHYDRSKGQGSPFHYFAYGAAVSEVEVDGFTGEYRLRRVDILHDVGDSLSPVVDLGQVEGGFFQGMGWLTLEELLWDAEGRLATKGASTYKLPSLTELPETFNVRLLERAAEPGVVYGSKAVGEPPLMLAISVREALKDAVAAFGTGGVVELASPATMEAVYWAIEKVKNRHQVAAD
ncbi:MAG TPA: xanthine dehydrogenase molybdopterin binding subunit [Meiothermus sp.]|nr:xanthine dehydrogenase molybdopterin binding subunit [Meiothermus sp.]